VGGLGVSLSPYTLILHSSPLCIFSRVEREKPPKGPKPPHFYRFLPTPIPFQPRWKAQNAKSRRTVFGNVHAAFSL